MPNRRVGQCVEVQAARRVSKHCASRHTSACVRTAVSRELRIFVSGVLGESRGVGESRGGDPRVWGLWPQATGSDEGLTKPRARRPGSHRGGRDVPFDRGRPVLARRWRGSCPDGGDGRGRAVEARGPDPPHAADAGGAAVDAVRVGTFVFEPALTPARAPRMVRGEPGRVNLNAKPLTPRGVSSHKTERFYE